MRKFTSNEFGKAARMIALAAMFGGLPWSYGQESTPDAAPKVSLVDTGESDVAFEQYASLSRLASAWRNLNSAELTDAAIQFAEGERVLLRPHKAISSAAIFDAAIRLAADNGDKESLGRLVKALEKSGDKARLAAATVALKTAGVSRAADPALDSKNAQELLTSQLVQAQIKSARVAGDGSHLDFISKHLGELTLNDAQRAALKKLADEAKADIPAAGEGTTAGQLLDGIAGNGRPGAEVSAPKGNPSQKIDLSGAVTVDVKEFVANLQTVGQMPGEIPSFDPEGDSSETQLGILSKLSAPSRSGYWYQATSASYTAPMRKYGRNWIWQYTNAGSKWTDNTGRSYDYNGTCCGQAACATVLGYWLPTQFPMRSDNAHVITLLKTHPPDGFSLGIGTSWQRMQKIIDDYSAVNKAGLKTQWINGESAVKTSIREGRPVMVMLDVAKDRAGGNFNLLFGMGGHWVVVYGYDTSGNYYITNWTDANSNNIRISGTAFRRGWGIESNGDWLQPYSNLTKAAGTTGWALKVYK